MKVREVYQSYQTPQNLQEHMLRVAAFASILLEGWVGKPTDKEAIIKACAIHDIAKPMTYDIGKQIQFGLSEREIEKLRRFQDELKKRYGQQEHQATVQICKDVGCSSATVTFVDNLEWKYIPRLLAANDTASLIPIYADMRIGPKGILSLVDRLNELNERVHNADHEKNLKDGQEAERKILECVKTNMLVITNDLLSEKFTAILDMKL